ncbi:MAG: 16S rRNA processing protein RimM [Candidatus Eremiobacteraeota bacterium]|nr:16S rRNA processing protein RimM [Candidatus Eremiobacteraeota bacterium]
MIQQDESLVGRIVGTFGLRGELKCDPTNAGRTVFLPGAEMRCARADDSFMIRIAGVRPHKGRLLVSLAGVDDVDAAASYAGAVLYAARAQIALHAGEYLDAELIGCAVIGKDGKEFGCVERVEHYPASDMLVVDGRMVPMVRAIVSDVDTQHRRIVIDPPAGLLD